MPRSRAAATRRRSIYFGGGGSAANVAAWLAAAGAAPVLAGRVGDDARGRGARAALEAAGVDARLAVDSELATGTCVVIVEPGGERTMMPGSGSQRRAGARATCPPSCLPPGGHLHVAGYALLREGSRARRVVRYRRGLRPGHDGLCRSLVGGAALARLSRACSGAGLLLPNADEARALTGEPDPERGGARAWRSGSPRWW